MPPRTYKFKQLSNEQVGKFKNTFQNDHILSLAVPTFVDDQTYEFVVKDPYDVGSIHKVTFTLDDRGNIQETFEYPDHNPLDDPDYGDRPSTANSIIKFLKENAVEVTGGGGRRRRRKTTKQHRRSRTMRRRRGGKYTR
jgi:hypothetical protein